MARMLCSSSCGPQPNAQPPPPMAQAPKPTTLSRSSLVPSCRVCMSRSPSAECTLGSRQLTVSTVGLDPQQRTVSGDSRYQAPANGLGDGLGAVGDLELGVDVLEVGAHGGAAQPQGLGGGAVGQAAGDELQDLGLARREGRQGSGRSRPGSGAAAGARAAAGSRCRPRDLADGLDDALGRRALEQIAAGAGPHRLEHALLLLEDGEDEDLGRAALGLELRG